MDITELSAAWELTLGAMALWREARGCSVPALTGVWHVILNRTKDPRTLWPKTVSEVVLQPLQFSSFNSNDPNATKIPTRRNPSEWNAFQQCLMVVTGEGGDPTLGATNYHSYPVGDPHWPAWATQEAFTVQIGPFHFYKL